MNPVVIKLGGSLLDDEALRDRALHAISSARRAGVPAVIVHGGGRHIDRALAARGIPKRTAGGLRVTDDETLAVVVATLAGTVNRVVTEEMRRRGIAAAGISGCDASLVMTEVHPPVEGVELGHVGRVCSVDPTLAHVLLAAGITPVIACLGADADGRPVNVNADSVAAAIAVGLKASRIVYLTDVEGFLGDDGSVVGSLSARDCREMLMRGAVHGGMRPKLESIVSALEGGVPEANIAGPATHATVLVGGMGGTRLAAA